MTQNKHINPKTGDLESDCNLLGDPFYPTFCYKDVSIVYITVSPVALLSPAPRIGLILNGETEVRKDFIVFLNVIKLDLNDSIMMALLEEALLTGNKVDLCVVPTPSNSYLILDVALKKQ